MPTSSIWRVPSAPNTESGHAGTPERSRQWPSAPISAPRAFALPGPYRTVRLDGSVMLKSSDGMRTSRTSAVRSQKPSGPAPPGSRPRSQPTARNSVESRAKRRRFTATRSES